MRLSAKISAGVTAILLVVNLCAFAVIGYRFDQLLQQSLLETARVIYKEVVVAREWVANHGGVYVPAGEQTAESPFLPGTSLVTEQGDVLVLRNPAMMTRELSALSEKMGEGFQFRATSLQPLNPDSAPDAFERRALTAIGDGEQAALTDFEEYTGIERIDGRRYFRYVAPLYTQEACLACHDDQGYEIGDVRGGLSLSMPIESVDSARWQSWVFVIFACLAASGTISLTLIAFMRKVVLAPLKSLEQAAERIGRGNYEAPIGVDARDEIGDLGRGLGRMQQEIQKTTERQLESEKMFALGQIAAGIAHDVRNPLFAIRNNIDYLKRRGQPADRDEVFCEIEGGLTRIGRIVAAVTEFARPHPPEFGRHDVHKVIARCISLLKKQFEKKRVEVELDAPEDLPQVEMDAHRIEQVLVNLMTNAMQAVQGRQGRVRVTARSMGDSVEISVADNGKGIAPEIRGRIFDPFFTRSANGTGLGLSIARRIVEQHGGDLSVESVAGEGANFRFRLPLRQIGRTEDAA